MCAIDRVLFDEESWFVRTFALFACKIGGERGAMP